MRATLLAPQFFCANCALDFDEPYCDACGASLTRKQTSGPEPLREVPPSRATEEATE